jgi:hypothetical protein
MLVFDVYLNDKKRCRAGVGPDGVLTAIVDWVKLTGAAARRARRFKQPLEESFLHVGGLSKGEHQSWLEQNLKIGDRVAIVVGKASRADPPIRKRPRQPKPPKAAKTTFLNVDLDIYSTVPLESLVKAFGRRVLTLYVGPDGRRHAAHLEMAGASSNPDQLIRSFVRLVQRLPRAQRRLWDNAQLREFNIGIQSASGPASYELHLKPATVKAASEITATIGVTVYGALGSNGRKSV